MNVQSKQTSILLTGLESKSKEPIAKKPLENKAFNLLLDGVVQKEHESSEELIENNSSVLQNTQEEFETSLEQEEMKDQKKDSGDLNSNLFLLAQFIPITTITQNSMTPREDNDQLIDPINRLLGDLVGNKGTKKQGLIEGGKLVEKSESRLFGEAPSKTVIESIEKSEEILLKAQLLVKEIIASNESTNSTIKTNNNAIDDSVSELIDYISTTSEQSTKNEGEFKGANSQNYESERVLDLLKELSLGTGKQLNDKSIPKLVLHELAIELNKLLGMNKEGLSEGFNIQNSVVKEQVKQPENQQKITIEESQPLEEKLPLQNLDSENQFDMVDLPKWTREPQVSSSSKQPEGLIRFNQLPTELSELITQRLQVMKSGEDSQIRIKLTPDNLGQLDIRLSSIDGKITAQIATLVPGTKEMIESQIHQLRHTLLNQGIQLDKLEVIQQPQPSSQSSLMQDGQSQQGQQFDQGKNRGSKRKGEYDVEDNVLLTQRLEEGTSVGINYSV